MIDNVDNKSNDITNSKSDHEIYTPIGGLEENGARVNPRRRISKANKYYNSDGDTMVSKYYSLPTEYFERFKRSQDGSVDKGFWLDDDNITEPKLKDIPLDGQHDYKVRSHSFQCLTDNCRDSRSIKEIIQTSIDSNDEKTLVTSSEDVKEQPVANPRIVVMDDAKTNKKTNNKNDITSTPLYKEIYMNKLRDYSFLHAKKLGITTNQSPQQLRKMYYDKRQKATVPKGSNLAVEQKPTVPKANNLAVEPMAPPNNNNKTKKVSTKSPPLRQKCMNKHKDSLTDISNMFMDKKSLNRTYTDTDYNILELAIVKEPDTITKESDCKTRKLGSTVLPPAPKRSESVEAKRRQSEAEIRRGYRLARLTSLENTVSSADTFMKNLKILKEKSVDEDD